MEYKHSMISESECIVINKSWENELDFLNTCNCCARHALDKPKKDKPWYDRGSPKRNLDKYQACSHYDWRAYIKYCMPCNCSCRTRARDISRKYRKYKIEKCQVMEELLLKFKTIFENTSECSICLKDFKKQALTTLNMCGHTFCKKCITKWFGFKDCIECPLCRTLCWSNTLHIGTWNQKCKVYI